MTQSTKPTIPLRVAGQETMSSSKKSLRLGVVGGGHLGRIHAKLAAANEQIECIGVADPSQASRELVSNQLGLPTYEDHRELIGKVDCAVIAAPTVHHYEVTADLLRSGVHCLVEKPLATTKEQSNRLVQIAKSHSRVLQVGHVERFNPMWTSAQDAIGAPKYIEAVRAGAYSGRSTDIGVVMDLMIHDLDLILSIDRSEVVSVQASGIAVVGTHEDIAEARIEFASGCIVSIRASRLAQAPTRRMQIYSASGYADLDFSADQLKVVCPSEDIVNRVIALDEMPAVERMAAKDKIFEDFLHPQAVDVPKRNAILDEHNDFVLSIETGCVPSVSGEDGARAVAVASQIVESVQQHAWDGPSSKPWRVGPLATESPRILPLQPPGPLPASENEQIRKAG
ncbi:MAG: Gfo/Idh/MocA family oxidoreductase [Planctomycetota bacterium]